MFIGHNNKKSKIEINLLYKNIKDTKFEFSI